jgi:hypothetical protein
MATHDVKVCPLMFSAIKSGSWKALIVGRESQDMTQGDIICFHEYDERANRYTNAEPLTVRIVAPVLGHGNDWERIPFGCFLIAFELVADAENPPVVQYVPVAKDARLSAMPRPKARWPF